GGRASRRCHEADRPARTVRAASRPNLLRLRSIGRLISNRTQPPNKHPRSLYSTRGGKRPCSRLRTRLRRPRHGPPSVLFSTPSRPHSVRPLRGRPYCAHPSDVVLRGVRRGARTDVPFGGSSVGR